MQDKTTKPTVNLPKFLAWSAKMTGKPQTFIIALSLLLAWIFVGLTWGFTDYWLLIINTIATINASLMVIIIQNTQYRESKALHMKIDELIKVTKEAEEELIAIEEMEEEELEKIRKKLMQKRKTK